MAPHPRRRLAKRLIFATLAAAAVGCLALAVYLRSGRLEEEVRERLVAGLGAVLGRPVSVESVSIQWLPPGAVVTGLRTEAPVIAASRVEASLSFTGLLRGRILMSDVEVVEPELEWDADGLGLAPPRSTVPGRLAPPGGIASRLELRRLLVRDGRVRIGSRRHAFSADLAGISLHGANEAVGSDGLLGGSPPGAGWAGPWAGTFSFREGRVSFGMFAAAGLSGTIGFEAARDEVRATRVTVQAQGIRITGSGHLLPGPPVRSRWDLRMRLDPASASIDRPLPQFNARAVAAEARLATSPEGARLTGRFEAEEPSFDLDRREEDPGGRPAWRARAARGTFEAAAGRIDVAADVELPHGGSLRGSYAGVRAGPAAGAPRGHEVSVAFAGLPIEELLHPFDLAGDDRVAPGALVSGAASLRWEASLLAQARGTADLDFAERPGALPVSGSASLSWLGRRVTIEAADLRTPGSTLLLTGFVEGPAGGGPARLGLEGILEAGDTLPLASFVEARFASGGGSARRPALRPSDLRGRLSARVSLAGTTARPEVAATFEAAALDASLPAPAGAGAAGDADAGRRIALHLDRASGRAAYGAGRLRLDLAEAAGEELRARGLIELDTARGRVLLLKAEADSLPVWLAAALTGLDTRSVPFAGVARAEADLAEAAEAGRALRGRIALRAAEAHVGVLPLVELEAEVALEPGRLEVTSASCRLWEGRAVARGAIDLSGAGAGGLVELEAEGIDLRALEKQVGGPAMAGLLDLRGRLVPGEPVGLEGTFTMGGARLAGIDLGRLEGTVGGSLEEILLKVRDESGALEAAGSLRPEAAPDGSAWTVEATLLARGVSLEEVRPMLPAGALSGLKGDADGRVTLAGPLADPAAWEVHALLDRVGLTAGDYPLRNDGPVRLTLLDRFLTLAPARLVGEKTDLTLGGSMVLGGSYELTALLEGTYDLGLVEVILPEMRASGPGRASLRVVQRDEGLVYSGAITLEDGRIVHPALPLPLEHVRGRAAFTELGLLEVEELTCELGGGRADGEGWARFEGASLPELHLAMKGYGIRAEILPDLNAFFDADVTLDKDAELFRFGGSVQIQRALYSRPFGIEPSDFFLRGREFAPASGRTSGGAAASTLLLDFDITAEGDVWIRNEDALIEASAHLSLEGSLDRPELSGRISTLEGGTYRFRDVTYSIVGGSLDFADVTRIDPLIDIEAATRVQSYEITLRITGRFSRPQYELTSEPPLPQRDIVWLLITGRTLEEAGADSSLSLAEGQVASYLAAPVAGAVSNPLEKILGVSSLQIDPFFLNGTADPSARVTVSKRVASNLLITYSASLGESGQEVYQVEYNPGRTWDLLGTRDFDGSLGADVRFRKRWGGPATAARGRPDDAGGDAPRQRVGRISIVADRLPDSERALVRRLPFDEGDPFRRGDLLEGRETLRQHYVAHGYPAARVEVFEEEPAPERPGVRDVRYAVVAGPAYDVRIDGPVRRRPLRRAVRQAWLEPLLLDDLSEVARDAVLHLLKLEGYHAAGVAARVETPGPERRVLRLEVDPGRRVKVGEVHVTGNEQLPEERIRRQMLTGPGGLLGRGLLKEPVLKDDAAAIVNLYRTSGFLSARVPQPEIALSPDGRTADVTVRVLEGPRSLVGAVAVEGEAPGVPAEELLRAAGLSIGQGLSPADVEAAADRIREALDARGYSRARVSWRLEGPPAATRAVFSIAPGERVRVQEVILEGHQRTNERVVRREITLDRGDWLSRAALLETQRNIYRLGVFRSVQIETAPVEARPGWVTVRVTLQEGPPLLTAWGLGYDSRDRARASFEVADNNLFGTRRAAGLFLRGSAVDRRVQLTLRDPNLFGERIETLLTGFWERQEFESFSLRRIGAGSQLTRKLTGHTTLYGRYRLEDIDLFDLQISEEETGRQALRLASAAASIARDTRDDIISPTRGGLASFDVRVYHHGVGSERDFTKLFASASSFTDLGHRLVWASSVRAGLLSSRDIPVSERFFAGGDTTLRGFEYNTVGPEDPETGKPVGGEGLFLLNQELRFPIYGALKGVVFYDAGNVFRDFSDYDLSDLRHVGGLGVRLDTPVGPFRIEFGRKLDRERGESVGEFFFSIGQAF